MSTTNVPELFGSMVFNEAVMKERLPKDVYKKLKQTMREGTAIDAAGCCRCCNGNEGLGDRARARPITPTGSSR